MIYFTVYYRAIVRSMTAEIVEMPVALEISFVISPFVLWIFAYKHFEDNLN